jgi:hypothetical protein
MDDAGIVATAARHCGVPIDRHLRILGRGETSTVYLITGGDERSIRQEAVAYTSLRDVPDVPVPRLVAVDEDRYRWIVTTRCPGRRHGHRLLVSWNWRTATGRGGSNRNEQLLRRLTVSR